LFRNNPQVPKTNKTAGHDLVLGSDNYLGTKSPLKPEDPVKRKISRGSFEGLRHHQTQCEKDVQIRFSEELKGKKQKQTRERGAETKHNR
jgi:hypothetical protein